jgi:hypothetical protein
MKKLEKNRHMRDQLQLLAAILAQWWRPVASSEALDLLHGAMHAELYRCTATAIKMASKVAAIFLCCCVCCCSDSSQVNMEQIVA